MWAAESSTSESCLLDACPAPVLLPEEGPGPASLCPWLLLPLGWRARALFLPRVPPPSSPEATVPRGELRTGSHGPWARGAWVRLLKQGPGGRSRSPGPPAAPTGLYAPAPGCVGLSCNREGGWARLLGPWLPWNSPWRIYREGPAWGLGWGELWGPLPPESSLSRGAHGPTENQAALPSLLGPNRVPGGRAPGGRARLHTPDVPGGGVPAKARWGRGWVPRAAWVSALPGAPGPPASLRLRYPETSPGQ